MPRDSLGRQHYDCACGAQTVLANKEVYAWKLIHSEHCNPKVIDDQCKLKECSRSPDDCKICYPRS